MSSNYQPGDPNDPRTHRRVQALGLDIEAPGEGEKTKDGQDAGPQGDIQSFKSQLAAAPAPRGQDNFKYDPNKVAGMDKGQYEQALGRPMSDDDFAKVQTHSRPMMVTRSNGTGGWNHEMTGAYGDNGYAKGRALEIGEGFQQHPSTSKAYPAGGVKLGGPNANQQMYSGFEGGASAPQEEYLGGDTGPATAQQKTADAAKWKPMHGGGVTPVAPQYYGPATFQTKPGAPGQPATTMVGGPNLHPSPSPDLPPWATSTFNQAQSQGDAMAAKISGTNPAPSSLGIGPTAPKSSYTSVTDPGNFEPYSGPDEEPSQPSFKSYLAAREKF